MLGSTVHSALRESGCQGIETLKSLGPELQMHIQFTITVTLVTDFHSMENLRMTAGDWVQLHCSNGSGLGMKDFYSAFLNDDK